jgi:hypothetical protein
MFTSNPFAEISASIAPSIMQIYLVVMIVLMAAGTIYDVLHKFTLSQYDRNTGEWELQKAPVHHIVD